MGLQIKRNKKGLYRLMSTINDKLITDVEWVDTQEAKNALIDQLFYDFIDKAIQVDIDFPNGYTVNGKLINIPDSTYWAWYTDKVNGGGNSDVYKKKMDEILNLLGLSEHKIMTTNTRNKIKSKAKLEFENIPEDVLSGEREIAEDMVLEKLCDKYGYNLSDYYNTSAKNLK